MGLFQRLLLVMFVLLFSSQMKGEIPTFEFNQWSTPFKRNFAECHQIVLTPRLGETTTRGLFLEENENHDVFINCTMTGEMRNYVFPPGIFEIDEQLLIHPFTSITGANSPNDMSAPLKNPDWEEQTLFLATRGSSLPNKRYCQAHNMITTRVGFVLSSHVLVQNINYQGIDIIRPQDNGGLCGGGAFETKGCALNDCGNNVNNAGSDGNGSVNVTIRNVRLNAYYYEQDEDKIGIEIPQNDQCQNQACCFCKPNNIRSTQVGVWVPLTRNRAGTQDLTIVDFVSLSNQADGINLHGEVRNAYISSVYIQNSGDDIYAVWGGGKSPSNITFKDCVGVNPGVLRVNWYGDCVATYGFKQVVFDNITCHTPTLTHPIPNPWGEGRLISNSMFSFHSSFNGVYPKGNNLTIVGWTFEDLEGNVYTRGNGSVNKPKEQKMAWTWVKKSNVISSETGFFAPYYFPGGGHPNVYVKK